MKQRYYIIETYDGLIDSIATLATTERLFDAVRLVRHLKKAEEDNPCYSFDFKKVASDIDDVLDWYPGESFDSFGEVINCENYKEFLDKRSNKNGNSNT